MLYSVEENLDLMDSEQVDQIIEELISDSDREWWLMRGGRRSLITAIADCADRPRLAHDGERR